MNRKEERRNAKRRLNRINERMAEVNKKYTPSTPHAEKLNALEEISFLAYERAVAIEDIERFSSKRFFLFRIPRRIKK